MNNGKRIELSFSLSWCYHRNYHQLGHYGPHWKKNPQKHLLPLVRRMMMMIMMMMMMIIMMMMIMMMMTMALTSSCASTWRGRSQEAWALEVASPDSTLLYPVSLLFGRLTSHLTTTIIITTTIVIIIVVIIIVIDDEDEEDEEDDDDDVDGQTLPHLRLGVEQLENGSHSSLRNIFDMANIWEIFSKE